MKIEKTKEEVAKMEPASLLRIVFGQKDGQSLADFIQEIRAVKTDEKFIAEVRAYASSCAA